MLCSRCVFSNANTGVTIDTEGICSICRQVESLATQYGTGTESGKHLLDGLFAAIKKAGRNRPYDCIVGVSGGTDSSYTLLLAVENGLRPLAVHYDNTWNTAQAAMNIRNVTEALGVDLYTYVVDNEEVDDIKRAFLLAGVREFDADTDIAFVAVLRATAAKYRIRYILEGHSFIAEGLSPVQDNYLDGGYVADIHKKYGGLEKKTFPNMTFWKFLWWATVARQKFVRPLWYIDYSKESAKTELAQKAGWQDYGGHHLENRASAFAHSIYLPQKFGIDYRVLACAARVRNGEITREEGLNLLSEDIQEEPWLKEFVLSRLGMTRFDLAHIMDGEQRTWRDFKNYKRRFEALRPMFYLLAKANLVPWSFYIKYCFPLPKAEPRSASDR